MTVECPPARTSRERLRDTRALLETEMDCWVATASGGVPHLVVLSFGWHDGVITLVTPGRYRTVRNLMGSPEAKLAFGTRRDVVVVEGTAAVKELEETGESALNRFAEQTGWDARDSSGHIVIQVTPRRMLAWRQENELAGRVLMRDGVWLDEEERP